MPDSFKTALAMVPAFLCAVVAFFFSFAISGAMWFNCGTGLLAFGVCLWLLLRHSARRIPIVIVSLVALAALVSAPTLLDRLRAKPAPDAEDLAPRIARAAVPLAAVDAGNGFADLAPLVSLWQGVRVVALGEATHGTSEFFRMKHRLAEFLITQMGFRHIAVELDQDDARLIDNYIQGKSGVNPVQDLAWPWRIAEFAAMVDWLRRYNSPVPEPDRVHFHGIDFQGQRRDFRMAQNTLALLQGLRPEARLILWAHNAHISNGAGWMGSYLKHSLRNQIYLTGFEFHHGSFTSSLNWVRTYTAEPAGSGYYASALARTGKPILFLDFRTLREDPALDPWLQQPRFTHEMEEGYGLLRLNPAWTRTDESWTSLFDGILYIEQSMPARLL